MEDLEAVSEPATLLLLGTGMASTLVRRGRRRARWQPRPGLPPRGSVVTRLSSVTDTVSPVACLCAPEVRHAAPADPCRRRARPRRRHAGGRDLVPPGHVRRARHARRRHLRRRGRRRPPLPAGHT
ncbi:MAG: PEP-CTERM sorting domain-containing protein [Acidimicrobiia bacterium]|nr:PEP-CTERM sorting domain-containing protein [Acidimicrobiia bacterium]